ncbi:hypothetical protein [Streptomyces nodosus]|uniref:hypothetical protein n=1 Tax=Streptomyces nodosus TaxID=40318 RepID=UPI0038141263
MERPSGRSSGGACSSRVKARTLTISRVAGLAGACHPGPVVAFTAVLAVTAGQGAACRVLLAGSGKDVHGEELAATDCLLLRVPET